MGRDYQHFDLIMQLYDNNKFEFDSNDMIVFTDDFNAESFKPEALIIWWILNLVSLNSFMLQFHNLCSFIL